MFTSSTSTDATTSLGLASPDMLDNVLNCCEIKSTVWFGFAIRRSALTSAAATKRPFISSIFLKKKIIIKKIIIFLLYIIIIIIL